MRFAPLFVLALAIVACGGDDFEGPPSQPPPSILGTYTIQTVDGEPLPWKSVDFPDLTVEVLSATITLDSDQSWSLIATLRETRLGEVTTDATTTTGTFVQSGEDLLLTDDDGETYSGTVNDGTLTFVFAGFTWVAVKQD
jgi:hypothetical protein